MAPCSEKKGRGHTKPSLVATLQPYRVGGCVGTEVGPGEGLKVGSLVGTGVGDVVGVSDGQAVGETCRKKKGAAAAVEVRIIG